MTFSQRFAELLEQVEQCSGIRYAAYRAASKLKVFQDGLGFEDVRLADINGILLCHRVVLTDHKIFISVDEFEHILHDLFYMKRNQVDACVSLTLEFFKQVYNVCEKISVLDLKVGLVCLSSSTLQSKYEYWFNQLSDHNLLLPKWRLEKMIESLLHIAYFLSESHTFNYSMIQSTLDSCYSNSSLGVDESHFICWILREPQTLVWLSTLYRMRCSEKVVHNVNCSFCSNQIKGLRYNCLQCLRYDLCQHCFFHGKKSKKHKSNHRIREYCSKTSSIETTLTYLKSLLDRLCGYQTKLQYLPAQKDENYSSDVTILEPQQKIDEMISQIESEKEILIASKSHVISSHLEFLETHLQSLKSLRRDIDHDIFMSTPLNKAEKLTPRVEEDRGSPGFSLWMSDISQETSYTQQLHKDLDIVMKKLNGLLDSNFTDEEEVTKV